MYSKPIVIDGNDPICSATSLEGTVIGILFEKSGVEIKGAISARIKKIDEEIDRKKGLVVPIRDFLKDKDDLVVKIEEIERKREKVRRDTQKPFQDQVDKLEDQISRIYDEMGAKTDEVDDQTKSILEEKKKEFFKGWKDLGSDFKELVEDASCERWDVPTSPAKSSQEVSSTSSSSTSSRSSSSVRSSYNGEQVYYTSVHSDCNGPTVSGNLKGQIRKYEEHFRRVKAEIELLVTERRRLEIIARNIDSERKFKLNLTQLSAFGFEDIEVR